MAFNLLILLTDSDIAGGACGHRACLFLSLSLSDATLDDNILTRASQIQRLTGQRAALSKRGPRRTLRINEMSHGAELIRGASTRLYMTASRCPRDDCPLIAPRNVSHSRVQTRDVRKCTKYTGKMMKNIHRHFAKILMSNLICNQIR